MSIRIVTATTLAQRSIMDAIILQCRRAQHKALKTVGIAGLLAAALTANIAYAAQYSHYRQFRASMQQSSGAAHYPPAHSSRSAPSQGTPAFVREPYASELNPAAP